ncbi:MAG: lipid-binding SYLF domain-containing protein [Geminicoccaceae bacterium]|nr:lipid-binding SYLF domain-containing protein [Geminicoccaceae bacterium]
MPRKPLWVLLAIFCLSFPRTAPAQSEPEAVVRKATAVLHAFLEGEQGVHMRRYVQNAYGVMVFPEMLRAGFLIGAEHGLGVFLTRDPASGAWRGPAYFEIFGGSIGLQLGGQSTDVVLAVMNRGAVDKLVRSRFKLGADVSMAVGRVGGTIGAGTTVNLGEDVYVFAMSRGLYGGVALDGSVVVPREDWTSAYFGRPVQTVPVLRGEETPPPSTRDLMAALDLF